MAVAGQLKYLNINTTFNSSVLLNYRQTESAFWSTYLPTVIGHMVSTYPPVTEVSYDQDLENTFAPLPEATSTNFVSFCLCCSCCRHRHRRRHCCCCYAMVLSVADKEIYVVVKNPTIMETIRLNRLHWFGHVQRMEGNGMPKNVLYRVSQEECARLGRMFLMLKYTDITQNTYIQSWTVTEIMAREVWKYDSCYTLIDYQIHIKTGIECPKTYYTGCFPGGMCQTLGECSKC